MVWAPRTCPRWPPKRSLKSLALRQSVGVIFSENGRYPAKAEGGRLTWADADAASETIANITKRIGTITSSTHDQTRIHTLNIVWWTDFGCQRATEGGRSIPGVRYDNGGSSTTVLGRCAVNTGVALHSSGEKIGGVTQHSPQLEQAGAPLSVCIPAWPAQSAWSTACAAATAGGTLCASTAMGMVAATATRSSSAAHTKTMIIRVLEPFTQL